MRRNYEEELPIFMEMLEKLLDSNTQSDKYFIGDDVSSTNRSECL